MNTRLYFGTETNPYHLSVGAVLVNNKRQVCCHHFDSWYLENGSQALTDLYVLMRETVENNESLEQAVHRGIKEEFGANGTIANYLGSIISEFTRGTVSVEKTTLYFLVHVSDFNIASRKADDDEKDSSVAWYDIDELIGMMKKQFERLNNHDFDEASILERAKTFLE